MSPRSANSWLLGTVMLGALALAVGCGKDSSSTSTASDYAVPTCPATTADARTDGPGSPVLADARTDGPGDPVVALGSTTPGYDDAGDGGTLVADARMDGPGSPVLLLVDQPAQDQAAQTSQVTADQGCP